jgi:hypothetical protein
MLALLAFELLERQRTSAYVSIRQHTAAYVFRMLVLLAFELLERLV